MMWLDKLFPVPPREILLHTDKYSSQRKSSKQPLFLCQITSEMIFYKTIFKKSLTSKPCCCDGLPLRPVLHSVCCTVHMFDL